jgi:hypothetical protein
VTLLHASEFHNVTYKYSVITFKKKKSHVCDIVPQTHTMANNDSNTCTRISPTLQATHNTEWTPLAVSTMASHGIASTVVIYMYTCCPACCVCSSTLLYDFGFTILLFTIQEKYLKPCVSFHAKRKVNTN